MTKLNIGCGFSKAPGFVNVDRAPECKPDLVFDVEQPKWPWDDNTVTEVYFNHSLEHLGQQTDVFLRIMQELYRVCAPQAVIHIHVPHPRHDNFISDPTHVRIITPNLMSLFDREVNDKLIAMGASNTPLAIYLNVDFAFTKASAVLTPRYQKMLDDGSVTQEEMDILAEEFNNVVEEYRITVVARK